MDLGPCFVLFHHNSDASRRWQARRPLASRVQIKEINLKKWKKIGHRSRSSQDDAVVKLRNVALLLFYYFSIKLLFLDQCLREFVYSSHSSCVSLIE